MAKRLHKTLLDYLVIAISPAMIIVLIDSLVLFLVEVFYSGGYEGRLEYVLTLFVIGAVLIGRISIEEGRERAVLFAIPLAIVTLLAICRFVEFQGPLAPFSFLINCGLIALTWWSADKLTWDCTLIDEQEEDSGEGLLETVGLDKPDHAATSTGNLARGRAGGAGRWGGSCTAAPEARPEGWQYNCHPNRGPDRGDDRAGRAAELVGSLHRASPPAARSRGLGGLLFAGRAAAVWPGRVVHSQRQGRRAEYAFQLLFVYTASGLGLLLSTSFLGLRRYLRQRRQEMPLRMVNLWLGIGVALIAGVMFAAMLLPRPNAEYAISDLPIHVGSPEQRASPYGMGRDGVEENRPDARLEPRDDAKPDAPQSDQPGDAKSAAGQSRDGKSADNQQKAGSEEQKAEQHGERGNAKPPEDAKDSPRKQFSNDKQPADDRATERATGKAKRRAEEDEKKAKPPEGSGKGESKPPAKSPEQRRERSWIERRLASPVRSTVFPAARAALVRFAAEMGALFGVGDPDRLGCVEESCGAAGGPARFPPDVGRYMELALRRKAA